MTAPFAFGQKLAAAPVFNPDYTPEELESMGVYDALYRGKGPRLASLSAWKPEWINPVDPKGWGQWYKRYTAGRRLEDEDLRQIKRWANFKSRHGGPFIANPTPRRGWALRNWAIDPSKLVPPEKADEIRQMLETYKLKKQDAKKEPRNGQHVQALQETSSDAEERSAASVSGLSAASQAE